MSDDIKQNVDTSSAEMNPGRVKILGSYLLIACILQIAIYFALAIWKGRLDWLIYFDPRLGLSYFESGLRGKEEVGPTLARWLAAAWISTLALFLLSGRSFVKTYIVSELVLSMPNLLFVLAIVWANLSPAHGFSVGELFFPLLVMIAFSVVPLGLAFWARRSKEEAERFPAERA